MKKRTRERQEHNRVRLVCVACAKAGYEGGCSSVLCPNRRQPTATAGEAEASSAFGCYRVPPRFNDN